MAPFGVWTGRFVWERNPTGGVSSAVLRSKDFFSPPRAVAEHRKDSDRTGADNPLTLACNLPNRSQSKSVPVSRHSGHTVVGQSQPLPEIAVICRTRPATHPHPSGAAGPLSHHSRRRGPFQRRPRTGPVRFGQAASYPPATSAVAALQPGGIECDGGTRMEEPA